MLVPIKDYNPTRRTAYITILFIIINTAVFFFQSYVSDKPFAYHVAQTSMVPYELTHMENVPVKIGYNSYGQPVGVKRDISPILSIFTAMFMHGSLLHLFGNMLVLWIFGNNIEDHLGKFKFILFYLACGVGAGAVHVLFNFNSLIPVLGASGAVAGIMGAYLVLYPNAQIKTLVFIFILITFVDLPAYIFLIIWFALQFFEAGASSGIAWLAHVGGFLIGIAIIKKSKKRKPPVIEIFQ